MSFNLRSLISAAIEVGAPRDESEKTWKAFTDYVDETLKQGKGLKIPKFATFCCLKNSTRDAGPGIKGYVFTPVSSFCRSYGVPVRKVGLALLAPSLEFNWAKLAYKACLDKDTAQITLNVLLRTLGHAIATGQHVRIQFGNVGVLNVQSREMTFRFLSMDRTLDLARLSQSASAPILSTLELDDTLQPDPSLNMLQTMNSGASAGMPMPMPTEAPEVPEEKVEAPEPTRQLATTVVAPTLETADKSKAPIAGARPKLRPGHKKQQPAKDTGISIFPKFTPHEVELAGKSRLNKHAIDKNLTNAFARLEDKLQREHALVAKHEADIQARQQLTTQLALERREKEKQQQDELNLFLKKQASEQGALRKKQREIELYSIDPQPERAYPMEQRLDLVLERKLKSQLKDALDEQVQQRQAQDNADMQEEKGRDRFLLECLQKEIMDERMAKLKGKHNLQESLKQDWLKQSQLSVSANTLGGKTIL